MKQCVVLTSDDAHPIVQQLIEIVEAQNMESGIDEYNSHYNKGHL